MQQKLQHKEWFRTTQILLGVLFLFCGCAIYLLFRSKTLYIYQWCISLGVSDFVDSCRSIVQGCSISDFVKFSLPDGLYCAAYILMIDAIWNDDNRFAKYLIISFVPIITIGSEILQYYHTVQGTFDIMDLTCYSIPPLTYIGIFFTNKFKFNKLKFKDL